MPVTFQILQDRGLVYVEYEGVIRIADSARVMARYVADPRRDCAQNQLIDLARATDWDRDYLSLMRLQAMKVDVFRPGRTDVMLVYHAPCPFTQTLARLVAHAWDGVPGVVARVQTTEADALHVLGQPESSFGALLQNA